MRSDMDVIIPSTSTLLFPDLMTRDELLTLLKYKFKRIGINTSKLVKLTDVQLLEQFKKFAMPKPQRKECIPENSHNKMSNIKDSEDSRKISMNELMISESVCNRAKSINGWRTTAYGKRCNDNSSSSSIEHHNMAKNARKHSPIRFP
ncbi:Developmental family protein [Brugia pahangi]|uniref:Ashwin n=1 Tax=Brugia pahangi TaxID=6280 RepID=A0A0N4TZ89_BRUPA|nr:unnamed protein product [Brugia pahangi]